MPQGPDWPSKRFNVSVPSDLYEKMEQARGDVPRSKFVKRALESVLDGGAETGTLQPPPAPTRTSNSTQAKQGVQPRPKAGKR